MNANFRSFSVSKTAAAALLLAAASASHADASLTATEILQQFNLVVLGNATSSSHVDGRTYIGGNATGGEYVQHAHYTPASAYAGLTVGGNASGNIKVNGLGAIVKGDTSGVNVNSGATYVGGSATGSSFGGDAWVNGAATNVNFNGAGHAASYDGTNNNNPLSNTTAVMNSTLAAANSTNFSSVLTDLSSQLSALKPTVGTSVEFSNGDHNVTFTGSGVNGVLVFDLTELDSKIFSSTTTDIYFNLSNATTVIFNIDDTTLSLYANFNQAQSLGSKLIWNFAGANSSVTIGRTFGGQVLVADGTFSNVGGANIEGGVFAKTLYQSGEIHLQSFTGNLAAVPEPSTYGLMAMGLIAMGAAVRRRQANSNVA